VINFVNFKPVLHIAHSDCVTEVTVHYVRIWIIMQSLQLAIIKLVFASRKLMFT